MADKAHESIDGGYRKAWHSKCKLCFKGPREAAPFPSQGGQT